MKPYQAFITILILLFMALIANAKKMQDFPRAEIKVSYACHEEHLNMSKPVYLMIVPCLSARCTYSNREMIQLFHFMTKMEVPIAIFI